MAASVNVVANPSRRRRSYRRPAAYRRRPAYRRAYRRTYRSRRRAPARRRRRSSPRLSKFMLGQIDPFDDRVQGAKIPDSNTMPSSTTVVNDETYLGTGATATFAAAAFQPQLQNYVYFSSNAGSAFTWGAEGSGGTSSRAGAVASNYQLGRVCSHGIRLSCPLAPTSVVGFCHIAVYPNDFVTTSGTLKLPTNFAQLNQASFYKRYTLAALTQEPLVVVNKILDCSGQIYRDVNVYDTAITGNADASRFHTSGWGTIVVALEGVPVSTTNALAIESIFHMEVTPLASGVDTASPAAPFVPSQLQAASNIARVTDATMFEDKKAAHMIEALAAAGAGFARGGLGGIFESLGSSPAVGELATGAYQWIRGENGISGVTDAGRLAE